MTSLIREVSREAKLSFLECHGDGHQWKHHKGAKARVDPIDAEPGLRPPADIHAVVGRRSTCTSCSCERVRWYAASGAVRNKYRYADGYLHKRSTVDDYAPSRLEYRRELFVTLFDDLAPVMRRA